MFSWGSEAKNYRVKKSFFGSRPIFREGKTPKIPFIGLSLFPNPKETLATRARIVMTRESDLILSSGVTNFYGVGPI